MGYGAPVSFKTFGLGPDGAVTEATIAEAAHEALAGSEPYPARSIRRRSVDFSGELAPQ